MKKIMAICSAAMVASPIFAAPVVSNVAMSQDAGRTVTITYTLSGEPGIVTVDVQTNAGDNVWVSIGGSHLTHFAGDANKLVQPGSRTITWKPRKAWPDNAVTENVKAVVSAWATNAPPDYMVMSLVSSKAVEFYASAEAIPFGVTNDLYKTDYLVMRKIPAANVRWRMGSPAVPAETGRREVSEVPHEVTLADDYYIGVYPVTQRQYQRITDSRPAYFGLDSDYKMRPVEFVSYEDLRGAAADGYDWPANAHAVVSSGFIGKLRSFTGIDGMDLPTDAQWEFACRAACGSALYNGKELDSGNTSTNLNPLARYLQNGGGTDPGKTCTAANGTAIVGTHEPNDWGLYDMLGNVYEWCLDWYADAPSGAEAETGPLSGTKRVLRGGSWSSYAEVCRSARRASGSPGYRYDNGNGFRLACPAEIH